VDLELGGKVAFVTGGSKGIGLAAARRYVQEGAAVGLMSRGRAGLEEAAAALRALGGRVEIFAGDVTSDADVGAAAAHMAQAFGRIDILVHSAGSSVMAENYRKRAGDRVPFRFEGERFQVPYPFSASTLDDWRFTYDVNVLSSVRVLKAVLPHMQRERYGRIVLVASVSGKQRGSAQFEYAAAKAAEIALANCLAGEVLKDGILVNSVCPTTTLTDAAQGMAELVAARTGATPEQVIERFGAENFPMGRLATAEEVGDVIVFLTSARASYVTGTSINIDGGTGRFLAD
jgi:3-oxoacyl-[acyl-carrier protein] reductase